MHLARNYQLLGASAVSFSAVSSSAVSSFAVSSSAESSPAVSSPGEDDGIEELARGCPKVPIRFFVYFCFRALLGTL